MYDIKCAAQSLENSQITSQFVIKFMILDAIA